MLNRFLIIFYYESPENVMEKIIRYIVVFSSILITISGCSSNIYYLIGLKNVERPAAAKERYGEQKITKVKEEGEKKSSFEDALVNITWLVKADEISFRLSNKTDDSIKIIWDEAAYINEGGSNLKVMHSGVEYSERNNPQLPSVIVGKGTLSDNIVPTNLVYFDEGKNGGWKESRLFPNADNPKALNKYVGKSVQVLLPMQIEHTVYNYIFTFEIEEII